MQPLCLIYQDISLQPFSPFPYRHPFEGVLHLQSVDISDADFVEDNLSTLHNLIHMI